MQGFYRVSTNVKDTALDCPNAEQQLASLSARAVAAGLLDADWVQQTTPVPTPRAVAAPQVCLRRISSHSAWDSSILTCAVAGT